MKLRSSTEVYREFNELCEINDLSALSGDSVRKLLNDKTLSLRLCKLHIEASSAVRRERGEKDWLPWGIKSIKKFKALIK